MERLDRAEPRVAEALHICGFGQVVSKLAGACHGAVGRGGAAADHVAQDGARAVVLVRSVAEARAGAGVAAPAFIAEAPDGDGWMVAVALD